MLSQRLPAFASRDFRIFWIGQFMSLVGSWMQATTQPYLAYRLTNQPIYLGLIGFAASLPALILTLPGAVWVERKNKRHVVIAMQIILMLQAFILAALALTGTINIWHIIILSIVAGSANSIEITARQAMVAQLVNRDALPNAIALNSTAFNLARVIGPALTAPFLILLKTSGEGWAFFANGVSFLFVILGLLIMRTQPVERGNTAARSFAHEFIEGQRFIRTTTIVAALIAMVTIPSLFGFPFAQQIPVFARDVLAVTGDSNAAVATRNSALVIAQGVGALIAALSLAFFSGIRHKGRLLVAGQFAFAIGLVIVSGSRSLNLSMAMLVLIGWGTVTQLALANTLIQLSVPDELRGRVVGTYLWAQLGATPFGSLLIGWMAQTLGAPTAVLICGLICLAGYIIAHFVTSTVRNATT